MIVTLVYIQVKPDHIDEFIQASRKNHGNSLKEQGNLRFDIIQKADDPSSFVFCEVYEDDEAIARHKKTPHYLEWRQTVKPWMAIPRKGVKYEAIFPEDKERW
jgi:autoinducer 2-degrading protein